MNARYVFVTFACVLSLFNFFQRINKLSLLSSIRFFVNLALSPLGKSESCIRLYTNDFFDQSSSRERSDRDVPIYSLSTFVLDTCHSFVTKKTGRWVECRYTHVGSSFRE